jgi:NDP-sugar pyrophosphorylase family protein
MSHKLETRDREPSRVQRAALIAAGRGERLREAGIEVPKPLIPIAGVALIELVLGAVERVGIRTVSCIFNAEPEADAVERHCRQTLRSLELRIIRRTTPSSMESLFALAPLLQEGPFLLLTVDAVFGPAVLPALLDAVTSHPDADGIIGVHGFIEDEKPLHVTVGADDRITAIGPKAADSPQITAGLYVFAPRIFEEIDSAREARYGALREFLSHLCDRGYRLYAARLPKTVDVDRPEDIEAAEAFVRSGFAED